MSTKVKKLHAVYSASGSGRWLACPGSINLSKGLPEEEESEYAKEGTRAHDCLEKLLLGRAKPLATAALLSKEFGKQMTVYAEQVLDYVNKRMRALTSPELHVEMEVALPVSKKGQFGTADIVIAELFGRLIVIDYKYGAGVAVYPENNSQLIYYALGVAHELGYNFESVELVIYQPRCPQEEDKTPGVRSWVTTVDTLLEWKDRFEKGIAACEKPNAKFKAGSHCRWCPAKFKCPTLKDDSLKDANAAFDKADNLHLPVVSKKEISVEQLPKLLIACDRLEIWIGAVREFAFNRAHQGAKIEGYKLVEKRSTRKWIDADKAEKRAKVAFGPKAFSAPELLSPAQLEKACGKKAKEFVAKHTTKVSSGLTLKPINADKSQAVTVKKAADYFEL